MKKKTFNFVVDLRIRYRGRAYRLSLAGLARWLVPLLIVLGRVASHMRTAQA